MNTIPDKILIIQTAFIGDAILASSLVESWVSEYPKSTIDVLVRKGNESLYSNNPNINSVLIWNKKKNKYRNLFKLAKDIRANKYDAVFNIQRYFATGFLTAISGAKVKSGFTSNPLSFLFSNTIKFDTEEGIHEIERNVKLLHPFYISNAKKPRLYPSIEEDKFSKIYKEEEYVCIAPTSVWFTKQWPKENWIELIHHFKDGMPVYLLGAKDDYQACEDILLACKKQNVINLAGKLSFLQSASLMKEAKMNYVNDSAPMHIASAVNAPTTVIYCSTLPSFGFGPLSENSRIIEYQKELACRPCGLHGKKECPEGDFRCAQTINQLIS
jgi:heptosyltransferase-2